MDLSDSQTAGQGLRRVSAMEAVLAHLRRLIERGEYAVGSKLPSEAALSREFEVSRSVIREALRGLQALGLTVSQTGKGTFVIAATAITTVTVGGPAHPTFGGYAARHLMEARRHVEIPVAGYAALRHEDEHLDRLAGLAARMEAEADDGAWVALDSLFHGTIAQASGNPVFAKVIEDIREALAHQSAYLNQLGGRRADSEREHRRIVAAIAEGSEDGAVAAMTEHLAHVEQALTTLVKEPRRS